MLGVEKDERTVCSLMLRGLTSEYEMVRTAMSIHFPRDREAVESHVRNAYLSFSVQGKIATSTRQALVAKARGGRNKSKATKPKPYTDASNSAKAENLGR
ncbi:unnamed protein product, partial [Sphacelaria rigidula]